MSFCLAKKVRTQSSQSMSFCLAKKAMNREAWHWWHLLGGICAMLIAYLMYHCPDRQ
jgi:hypothetical protein